MSNPADYTPPKVWEWEPEGDGIWAKINRPVAGAMHDQELPVGKHPIQLYSKGTANGVKVTVMLEELIAIGQAGTEYDKHVVEIFKGEQFGSGFVEINPNSKVPALVDYSTDTPTRVFESGAILLYLANKFNAFLPSDLSTQAECLSWLFWQVGSAPYIGGGFGHFYRFAPQKMEYPINRYTMEVKRQFDVLDRHLADRQYVCGDEYTIADIAIWPWYFSLIFEDGYGASEFLAVKSYQHVVRWASHVGEREGAQRGYSHRET